MKKIFLLFCFFISFNSFSEGTTFEVKKIPFPDAISLFWGRVLNKPFMLAPELVSDERYLSFNLVPGVNERDFIIRYLKNMNVGVSVKNGVDYIYPFVPARSVVNFKNFVYKPKFRSVEYLSSVLQSAFVQNENIFSENSDQGGKVVFSDSVQSAKFMNNSGDKLFFRGSAVDIENLKLVLNDLDTRADQVDIVAYVYEVNISDNNGSGMALVTKLLDGKFNFVTGVRSGFSNFIQISVPSIDALYEIFSSDSRFKVVSSPSLRVISGEDASFSVGSSVPVLGSVTYNNNIPVQSVEYKDSGVIFKVKPVVSENIISMNVEQQLSNFSKTDTGVNNSPTLIQRNLKTTINLNDGDIIVLGGLAENKDTNLNSGFSFLPDSFKSRSKESNKVDIVVFLQAKKIE